MSNSTYADQADAYIAELRAENAELKAEIDTLRFKLGEQGLDVIRLCRRGMEDLAKLAEVEKAVKWMRDYAKERGRMLDWNGDSAADDCADHLQARLNGETFDE